MLRGARKLMGENLEVVRAEFSTLSWAVFDVSIIIRHRQACPHLELKMCPRS
jgi:hypothetical protein